MLSLKYQRCTTSGYKDMCNRKLYFKVNNHGFLKDYSFYSCLYNEILGDFKLSYYQNSANYAFNYKEKLL